MGAIQPAGVQTSGIGTDEDTVLRHPHSSVPLSSVPAVLSLSGPGHPLCSLCLKDSFRRCNSGRVKTELGLWGARAPRQVLFIGTAVGGVSVTGE